MKKLATFIATTAILTLPLHAVGVLGLNYDLIHANLTVGQRTFGSDLKQGGVDLTNGTQFGVDTDIKVPVLGLNVVGGYFQSKAADNDDGTKIKLQTDELRLGVRKYVSLAGVSVNFGGGLTQMESKLSASGLGSNKSSETGAYAEAGVMYKFNPLTIGFNVTYVTGTDISLDDSNTQSADLDGLAYRLQVGIAL